MKAVEDVINILIKTRDAVLKFYLEDNYIYCENTISHERVVIGKVKWMKKFEEKYINLLQETIKSKNETIERLLRINENLIQETRNMIYELRKYLSNDKEVKKWKR